MQKVNVLVVKLDDKICKTVGFDDVSDTTQIYLDQECADYLRSDKKVWDSLDNYFKDNLGESGTFWGETELYHLTGTFGKLKIYTKEVHLSDELLKVA